MPVNAGERGRRGEGAKRHAKMARRQQPRNERDLEDEEADEEVVPIAAALEPAQHIQACLIRMSRMWVWLSGRMWVWLSDACGCG